MGVSKVQTGNVEVPGVCAAMFSVWAFCAAPRGVPRGAVTLTPGDISCCGVKNPCMSPDLLPVSVPLIAALVLYFLAEYMPVLRVKLPRYEDSGREQLEKAASLSHV